VKIHPDFNDFLTALTQEEIWDSRQAGKFGGHDVHYISRESYINYKRAVGRHKNLAGLELLGERL
jgi:hypothetical protein